MLHSNDSAYEFLKIACLYPKEYKKINIPTEYPSPMAKVPYNVWVTIDNGVEMDGSLDTIFPDGTPQKPSYGNRTTDYSYDANSNVSAYELVKGGTVQNSIQYEYDKLNQLTKLSNNDIITSYTYDANGNLIKKALNNGVTTNYTYNKANLMTKLETKKGSNVYTASDCLYLLNGLLRSVYMPFDGYNDNELKTKHYNYDSMGRLINEYVANAASQPVSNEYEYDTRNNRIKMIGGVPDDLIQETTNYEYDSNNRLLNESSHTYDEYNNKHSHSSVRYYYDNNGNMTAKQSESSESSANDGMSLSGRSTYMGMSIYRYDAFNRLTNYNSGSAEASYTYNANNLRASKTVNREKTDFVWNGQNLAAENKAGSVNTYTYDVTGVHIANQNGNITSYLKDYHGNVVGTATAAGTMVQEATHRMDYDAFGNQWIGNTPDPFGYCGEYYDNESGLIYLRNRYYDQTTGRFITEDPAKDGLNWYAYCSSNPVMYVDPSGYITEKEQQMYNNGELSQSVYNILMNLTHRWEMMTTIEDKNEVHKLAEQFRNNGYYAQDCTEAANTCLWDNGQYYINQIPSLFSISTDYGVFASMALDWESKVLSGGEWDYKVNKADWMPENGMFILYGELISDDDFGNINYGYTGTIVGFGPISLYTGGGWAAGNSEEGSPFYGDSQVDHYFIEKGIMQAEGLGFNGQMYNFDVRSLLDIVKEGKEGIRNIFNFFSNVLTE